MSLFVMKLPDVGEGVAEAELVEWLVGVGDHVTPDTVIAEVLTDKATVEVSAPVDGEVVALHGEPGDVLAVGGDLIGIETDQVATDPAVAAGRSAAAESDAAGESDAAAEPAGESDEPSESPAGEDGHAASAAASTASVDRDAQVRASWPQPTGGRSMAAPAVRGRAADLGIDLSTIAGSGPGGRVLHADLDRALTGGTGTGTLRRPTSALTTASDDAHAVAVRGMRRRIAERLSAAWREIPHITYVDDVDVTELERLRSELNQQSDGHGVRLTILPFVARAIVIALADQPELNAHYDHGAETLTTFDAVHIGIATQTDDGLSVPVVRHAEGRGVRGLATEIARVAGAARDKSATRAELTGSTITITSLGALGGLATTPIINPPEVAIVGVNKMETRPLWRDGTFQPRQVMNLSSSFDHRMVDGWNAATFVQRVKSLLETPALLFVTDD